MRHLEHLPRYSATFTSIHIVSTLILDVREFILEFFWYFWNILRSCHIHLNTYCVNIATHWYWLWENSFSFLKHLEIPPTNRGAEKDEILNTSQIAFSRKDFKFCLFYDFNDRLRQRHEMLMKRKAAWKSHFRTDVPQNCPTRHLPELIVGRHTTMTNCQPPAFSLVVGTFSNFVDKSI